jgi:hypothetical protein
MYMWHSSPHSHFWFVAQVNQPKKTLLAFILAYCSSFRAFNPMGVNEYVSRYFRVAHYPLLSIWITNRIPRWAAKRCRSERLVVYRLAMMILFLMNVLTYGLSGSQIKLGGIGLRKCGLDSDLFTKYIEHKYCRVGLWRWTLYLIACGKLVDDIWNRADAGRSFQNSQKLVRSNRNYIFRCASYVVCLIYNSTMNSWTGNVRQIWHSNPDILFAQNSLDEPAASLQKDMTQCRGIGDTSCLSCNFGLILVNEVLIENLRLSFKTLFKFACR